MTANENIFLVGEKEVWTIGKFKDEFFLCLSRYPQGTLFLFDKKYYAQAQKLIHWIPIIKNKKLVPPFIINISDLTPRVREELKEFIELNNEKQVIYLLKEIATKFFENIDFDYTHGSVLRDLIVRLEK